MKAEVKKGVSISRNELSAINVGLIRLKEMGVPSSKFSEEDIKRIGYHSIYRMRLRIGKIGKEWSIECNNENFKPYYIVAGKKVITLHPSLSRGRNMEQMVSSFKHGWREREVALSEATTEQIFFDAYGRKPTRKCKAKVKIQTKLANESKCILFGERSK